ncbi:hypothetical protein PR202_ga29380 [Eleusine coracana subsp. coracana]|uniref:Major facilitator superfamily (MFS) profile domain-containing protein n=1 Tax=Eleusine coracana subsp. coracana TaxID=191504 RepID=A0AAV5DL90_ELECO|nr:hypothetical protein PR202_ga29380 [Eleusine coracana subsp. coracana]
MHGGKNTRDGRPPDSGKPIRRALNKYTFATAVLSSATPLFLGYDLAVAYSTAVTAGADLKLLSCTVALSSLLGAVAATAARRLIGDRRAVLLASAALFTGALARGGPAAALFTTGAIVNGVGTGLALAAVPACAADLSPQSARGALASHPDGLLYLGCILGSLCCNVLKLNLPPRATWQVVMISVASCVAGPALLLGSVVLLLPESPRWLVATDRASEARRVIAATSATLEEAELRFLEINDEPLRRAVVTALVAKLFQQASVAQYVYRAFRDAGLQVVPRALAAFGFVAVVSLSASLVVVELGLQLVRAALAGGCGMSQRAHSHHVMTRRQEEVKWARGLSATMLLSLVALGWVALGPARWEDDAWCPPWMSATAAAVNSAVSSAILALFVRVDEFSAAYGSLLACPAVVALVWLCFCVCLLGATRR